MQSRPCFVLITVSLLFAFTCINRHFVFVNYLSDQLPRIGALLAIGCFQPPSLLASHSSSASLQLLHRYTSVLVGVALLGHHSAEAMREAVNATNFNRTSYGSNVKLQGDGIFVTLDKDAHDTSITWKFTTNTWQIQLDKCNDTRLVEIVIADSCEWKFLWDDEKDFKLIGNDGKEKPWKFSDPSIVKNLLITIGNKPPMMSVYAVTDDRFPRQIPSDSSPKLLPEYCMLATASDFNVNVTLRTRNCPINVTIVDAELLYDFPEPTTMTSTPPNGTWNTTTPLWNGTSTTSNTGDSPTKSNVLYYAIGGGIGGLLLLAAIGGLIVFFCIRRRRPQQGQRGQAQEHFDVDDDPNLSKQVVEKEGLIEWQDAMAHAAYEAKPLYTIQMEDWPFAKGDTVELSTITQYELYKPHYRAECKHLEFWADVKGNLDYDVCPGMLDPKDAHQVEPGVRINQGTIIYYSFPSDRVKAFVDRLKRLGQKRDFRTYQLPSYPVRVPELRYFWISSAPEKCSYLVVLEHGRSVAEMVTTTTVPVHRRVGWAFTTFVALASIHQLGCVHRDVTPAAFVVRMVGPVPDSETVPSDSDFVYITHLSLSRFQYNAFERTWMPRRRRVKYFGTHKYASRAAHAEQERSFKDDLESWFYTAVELIWPTKDDKLVMPWHLFSSEIGVTDRAELHKKYHTAKDNFLGTFDKNKLIVTFPAAQFRKLAGKIQTMTFGTLEITYKKQIIDLLYEMVEQLPAQADEANHQDVLNYIVGLNECECYDSRQFEFKSRNKSGSGRLPPAPTNQGAT